jgi:hypothetical protein
MAMPAGGGAGEMPASRGRPAGRAFCKMQNAVQFAKSRPPATGRRPPSQSSMRRDPPFLRQERDGMAVARKRPSRAGASPALDASTEDTAFSEGWGKRPSGRFLQPRGSGAIFPPPPLRSGPAFSFVGNGEKSDLRPAGSITPQTWPIGSRYRVRGRVGVDNSPPVRGPVSSSNS